MNVPKATVEKGQRLVDDGKVTRVKGTAFIVLGSTGNPYDVWLSYPEEASGRCDCPSSDAVCPHIYAASVYHLANPEEISSFTIGRDPFRGIL